MDIGMLEEYGTIIIFPQRRKNGGHLLAELQFQVPLCGEQALPFGSVLLCASAPLRES